VRFGLKWGLKEHRGHIGGTEGTLEHTQKPK